MAMAVSDPRSDKYGKYLSAKDVQELTQPGDADVHILQQWLNASSVPYRVRGIDGFELHLAIEEAETLFQTKFYKVSNAATGQQAWRASSYSLPADIEAVVAAVYGIHGLPLPPRMDHPPQSERPMEPFDVSPSALE